MKAKLLFLVAIIHFLNVCSYGSGKSIEERMQEILDKGISKYGARGVSAAVIFNDKKVWTGTSGISHDTVSIRPDMLFAIGSVTKNVVAALTLKLAEENIFDLFHIRYNAAHRGAEKETFPYLQGENRPGVVSYTATRWGQLLNTKKMPPNQPQPSASDCYRFVLSCPSVDVCMCGPKNTAQMKEALRALELGPLNPEELERMRRIGDYVHAHTTGFF